MKAIIEAFEEELERVLNIDDEYGDGFELEVPDAVAILTALKAGQAAVDTERACRAVEALGVEASVAAHLAALQECERAINGLLAAYEETPE